MIYFISDLHLFHKNSIKFDNRPFKDIEEMHNEIIKRWNSVVTKEDTVYILGDISFGLAKETISIIKQLNYKELHLIVGNHDTKLLKDKHFRNLFVEICDYKELIIDCGVGIVMCHYPIPCFKNHYYDWFHLYGHTHNSWEEKFMNEVVDIMQAKYKTQCKMTNVGCMNLNYTPISLDEVMQIVKK